MEETPVMSALEGGVLTLMLNRPQRLNAMNNALIEAMNHELARARDDRHPRVLLTGTAAASAPAPIWRAAARSMRRPTGRPISAPTWTASSTR
jgi:hypothetical protein